MNQTVKEYAIGIMKTPLGEKNEQFDAIVDAAVAVVEDKLASGDISLSVDLFQFAGPHLRPSAGTYSPLDFLRIGLVEKLERDAHFLVVITEVDLAAESRSYVLGLPSELTNVGVISTKRLNPSFWGDQPDQNEVVRRLAALMLHIIGHLLTLPHRPDRANVMYDFKSVQDLSVMQKVTTDQQAQMRNILPHEARDETHQPRSILSRVGFALGRIFENRQGIWRATMRANPFDLVFRLPTMITAAISITVVLFFSAETWDVASTIALHEIAIFAAIAIVAATSVLYRAYALPSVSIRSDEVAESVIVTQAATVLSLVLTMLVMYVLLFMVHYFATLTIFPRRLMATWPTVDPAVRTIDHVKLALFMGAMGTLGGSLGGRAENKAIIRHILFLDEEA